MDDYRYRILRRLDPRDCGCTDCLTGYSKPLDVASDDEIIACALGRLQDATGLDLASRARITVNLDVRAPE